AVAAPWLLPPVLVVFIVVLALTGYVGLGTVLATASAILWVWLAGTMHWVTGAGINGPLFWFTIIMSLLIAYTHRSNLQRLAKGTEHQFTKILLFKPKA
ncbi:MAG TPA: glycerol-3-phosphate acyltransferase, partial [Gammaproteobacteria bacterium]|nr:glycerol-3-phosphate acyltransferase [Gammaproteobacteria bacterium]